MQNKLYSIIYAFMLLLFMACSTEETSTYRSYDPSITMSDGQVVTYKFTYADGNTSNHTIEKISDGDMSGEIIYTIDNAKTSNYKLREIGPKNIALSSEEVFLLLGWNGPFPLLLNKADSSNSVDVIPENGEIPVVPDPLDSSASNIIEDCNEAMFTVGAGEFRTEICTYVAEDNSSSYTRYLHQGSETNTPLDGLLKYQKRNSQGEVTVELIEWNGI